MGEPEEIFWKPVTEPDYLLPGWKEFRPPFAPTNLENAQRGWRRNDGLVVVVDCAKKEDGKFWRHVSFSRKDRMPSYYDITDVKKYFVGEKRKAIFVLPAETEHVNIHSYCLHLWACEEDDGLPEFSGMIAGMRSI